ncbi:MAG: ribonuclease HI [Rickettsiales bacterium]|jgi:ribonuclease HI|nr:ribonuclease HI [Rickettsiales bacterium]MDA9573642.1 ribonuclease HI [Rickettsiales bacterium]|tara:strand:- start:2703 stop:3140 length:438 start_codon:yes stop_codon:yes gene_type:complete
MAVEVEIYSDGACLGNPGPGGWGAILMAKDKKKEISGSESDTTNNRMELTAVIEALKTLKKPAQVKLYTDSKYVIDGITKWIFSWKKTQWRNSNRKLVKNADLWQNLDHEVQKHKIKWIWVKGHNGNFYNELVDNLARKQAESIS